MSPAERLVALLESDSILAARVEGDALAAEVGGDLARRWYIAVIRAVMVAPPDGDTVRELYGELVDRYREQPDHLAVLRALGDEIRALEASGKLPSTLVARSERRKH